MTIPVGGVSPQTLMTGCTGIGYRRPVRFAAAPDPVPQGAPDNAASPSEEAKPKGSRMAQSLGNVLRRVKNAFADTIDIFSRDQIGTTIKRVLIYTTVLTLSSVLFLGPFSPMGIPLYAAMGFGWEAATAFFNGLWRNPDDEYAGGFCPLK